MAIELKRLQALAEANTLALNEMTEAETVKKVLKTVESKLPRDCRYKSYEQYDSVKTIEWVTQESEDEQGAEAAKTIAKLLTDAGVTGWTVKVTIRDEYDGDGGKTKWQGIAKS